MAITYELIGKLGGGASEVMEHTAVFSDSTLRFNALQTDIPVGSDVAVFVEAQSASSTSSAIIINGEEFRISSGTAGSQHGWKILRGVSTVQIRGRGYSNNTELAAPPESSLSKSFNNQVVV